MLQAGAAFALSGLPIDAAVAAEQKPLPLSQQPQSAIILQVAENTAAMQGIMIQSAKDMEQLTLEQRVDVGRPPISRGEMKASIDVILKNSKLATFPNADDAADTLRGVKLIAGAGQGDLTIDEFRSMAKQYQRARDELRKVFEALPEDQQATGKAMVREMRAADEKRVREFEEEQELVRVARAKIAEENSPRATQGGEGAAPPRKKTLAELEASQKQAFGRQQCSRPCSAALWPLSVSPAWP